MATITAAHRTEIAQLYVAFFGRAPDAQGMEFWAQLAADGRPLADIANTMFATAPARAYYPAGADAQAIVRAFYVNTLGREPDAQGLAFWTAKLGQPGATPGVLLNEMVAVVANYGGADPAGLASARLFANRTEVAVYYAGKGGTVANATEALSNVGADPASVAAAKLRVDGFGGTQPTPPAPAPSFSVSKDAGNIVGFGAAGAQITVALDAGVYTFTSGSSTGTAAAPVAGIAVPAGSTLTISSALAAGKAFSGAGTALVVADAGGEDLAGLAATGIGALQLTSGQNYTLTAAQGAIAKIGSGGAVGTLTDAGTTTVSDTLAALGDGVAATLKAQGADNVLATAAVGADISAIGVAGIDSITLASGQNYTMTAAQAALVTAAPGTQTVTLTTQATGTLNAAVESFVLGNFANAVSLGSAAQNVSSTAGTATTLSIGGSEATGTWALANGADVVIASAGAVLSGVNSGMATTAETLQIDGPGNVTLTQIQHEALTAITGAGTARIGSGGTVTGKDDANSVANYSLSAIASNTFVVAASKPGVNLSGSSSNATTVNLGGNTANGTWALNFSNDILRVTDGANFAAVNNGNVTTAESLVFTGNGTITMTAAQHAAMVFSAAGTNTVQIASAGSVAAQSSIESYTLFGSGANSLSIATSRAVNVSQANGAGASATVTIGGTTPTGTWALSGAADTIVATTGANIAGINGGAATTAENLTLTGGISMTQAQHEAFTGISAAGGSDFVTVTSGGAITARAGVETYTVSSGGSNSVAVTATTNVNGNAGNATTVNVGGNTVSGNYSLAHTADVLEATDGANIAAATTSSVERLAQSGTVTMRAAQYASFLAGGITATGASDRIILTTALTSGETLHAAIENFTLAAGSNTVTLGAAQSIDAQALTAGQTLTLAGTSAAAVSLAGGNLNSGATGAITVTAGAGANTITLGAGNDTVNAGDGNDVITGGGGADTLNGEGGDDTFLYASLGEFITGNQVVDRIDGGSGTDTVLINGSTIVLTTASDLGRMTTVEVLKAQTQSASARAHSIVVNSDTFLGGLNTVDLSGDTNASSSGNFDFRGVTQGMTLKGVGSGANSFRGGSGVDTLSGGNGADTFYYHDAASFITGTAVVDSIDGGGGTDTLQINSAFTIGSTQSLDRITNVEVLRSESQSVTATGRTYATTFLSDANLGSIGSIDLSFDLSTASSASVDVSGATRAMTVNGVGRGANKIWAGQGADTLQGGNANDYFFFKSAAHAAGDVVNGGGGTNYGFLQSTTGETLAITNNFIGVTSFWITTSSGGPGSVEGTTSENLDASAYTLGNLVLNGNAGDNRLTGGAGNDNFIGNGGRDIMRGGGGNDTLQGQGITAVFEATAAANGQDTILSLAGGGRLDFGLFLGAPASAAGTAIGVGAATTLLLNGANNIGVRFGSTTVSAGDITTSTANAAGKIALADNGRAVVMAFASATAGDRVESNGRMYYVWDADPGAATDFQVQLVGTLSFGTMSAADMATAAYYV